MQSRNENKAAAFNILLLCQVHLASFCSFKAVYPSFTAELFNLANASAFDECLNRCYNENECIFVSYCEGVCYGYRGGSTVFPAVAGCETYEVFRDDYEPTCHRTVTVRSASADAVTTPEPLDSACEAGNFLETTSLIILGSTLSNIDRKPSTCRFTFYKERPDFCTPLMMYRIENSYKAREEMEQGGTLLGYVFAKYCKCGATFGVQLYGSKDGGANVAVVCEQDDPFPPFPNETMKRVILKEKPLYFVKSFTCA